MALARLAVFRISLARVLVELSRVFDALEPLLDCALFFHRSLRTAGKLCLLLRVGVDGVQQLVVAAGHSMPLFLSIASAASPLCSSHWRL